MESAFGTNLAYYKSYRGVYRGREGPITIPKDLQSIINGVYGSDNRPQFTHRRKILLDPVLEIKPKDVETTIKNVESGPVEEGKQRFTGSFTVNEVAKLYNFPDNDRNGMKLDGSGQCIGIIECGGGFYQHELETYFADMNIPMPEVTAISVGDGSNNPGVDLDADGEVFLDIAVAGSVAPKAKIVVYFAKMPTTNDVIDAILQAIHQSEKDSTNNPTVIPISWGSPRRSCTW